MFDPQKSHSFFAFLFSFFNSPEWHFRGGHPCAWIKLHISCMVLFRIRPVSSRPTGVHALSRFHVSKQWIFYLGYRMIRLKLCRLEIMKVCSIRRGVQDHYGYVDHLRSGRCWMIVRPIPNQIRSNSGYRFSIYASCLNRPPKGQGELIGLFWPIRQSWRFVNLLTDWQMGRYWQFGWPNYQLRTDCH